MSGDVTRPMPSPSPYPLYQAAGPRRRRRWPFVLLGLLVVVALLLVGADRAGAAIAGNLAAQRMQQGGFPGTPHVTIEGFPFLTQLAARDFQHVHITASGVREGPVTASVVADATGVRLNPGFQSGVVSQATATVLVSFSSLTGFMKNAGFPADLRATADGPDKVKITATLAIFSATIIASITQAGPNAIKFHIISADGVPASMLSAFTNMTVPIPKLPYGLTVQSVSVTSQGLVGRLSVHNFHFSQ